MYSRRIKVEEARNKRKAIIFILLTVAGVVILFFYGIPTIAKFSVFLAELRTTSKAPLASDTTPPPPPRIEPLPKATKETKIEIKGTTEPGVTVVLILNGKEKEIIADSDGQFTYSFSLNKGENTLTSFAKDTSGNESIKGETYKIIYDDKPPSLEINKPPNGSEFFGSRQRQVVIEGKTEESAKVQINDRFVVVESDGRFTFATTLAEGANSFKITAEDEAGNKAEEFLSLYFTP